jgi:hypothetical protein
MGYVTVVQLRAILHQVKADSGIDELLQQFVDEATDEVERYLGFKFLGYDAQPSERGIDLGRPVAYSTLPFSLWSVYAQPQLHPIGYLVLPWHQQGSITAIKLGIQEITDYQEQYDNWRTLYRPGGWWPGRYLITAVWGYGAPPPGAVKVVRELAVNAWRGRERGMYSDIVGAEGGGAVGYARALTNEQRLILDTIQREYQGVVAI